MEPIEVMCPFCGKTSHVIMSYIESGDKFRCTKCQKQLIVIVKELKVKQCTCQCEPCKNGRHCEIGFPENGESTICELDKEKNA
jgi:transposase